MPADSADPRRRLALGDWITGPAAPLTAIAGTAVRATVFFVAGEAAGSKLEKAERLEVTVLDEAALLALLGSG